MPPLYTNLYNRILRFDLFHSKSKFYNKPNEVMNYQIIKIHFFSYKFLFKFQSYQNFRLHYYENANFT